MKKIIALIVIALSLTACQRITTGEVGVRVDAYKQVQGGELLPGSVNQTMIGDVLTFPVKDIAINLENKTPMTADNSALADFDLSVVYALSPTSVSELYTKKSKSFHAYDEDSGDTFLMYNYVLTLVNNAAYKSVREYKALEVSDNRAKIEANILKLVAEQLVAEKLDTAITLSVVQVRNVQPNADILKSATEYVKAQNDLKIKETEVAIAKKESERMAALTANSGQSIAFMNAQAQLEIAKGIANGKVNTIVVPFDFKGIVNTK